MFEQTIIACAASVCRLSTPHMMLSVQASFPRPMVMLFLQPPLPSVVVSTMLSALRFQWPFFTLTRKYIDFQLTQATHLLLLHAI